MADAPPDPTAPAWSAEAIALITAGKLDEAETLFAGIMAREPGNHAAAHHMALLFLQQGRPRLALRHFLQAVELSPGTALYHRNICEVLRGLGRLDEALAHAEHAVALDPGCAGGWYNKGIIHYDRLEMDLAIAADRRAVDLDPMSPGAHFELCEALLITGQFEEGWREYEWRWKLPNVPPLLPPHQRPHWDGAPLPADKTLLLIADQGFGDSIQFCRFIPAAAERCSNIVVAASREIQPVIGQMPGIKYCEHRYDHLPAFEAYCPLTGLPRLLGTDSSNIPMAEGYLKADPARIAHWRKKLDGLLPPGYRRIGLAWAGRPTHGNDANRSLSLEKLRPLFDLEDTVFISFQMGTAMAQLGQYFGKAPLINLPEKFPDVMAIMTCLDRHVSVDTSLAHLAGALGRPVSILLPYAPDWRWLLNRTDSPWYSSATLHRQDRPGDWDSAIAKLIAQLAAERA